MINTTHIDELTLKIKALLQKSPTQDLDKNLNALLRGALSKFELVSRDEYDTQVAVLAKTQQSLAELELKLAEMEATLESINKKQQ